MLRREHVASERGSSSAYARLGHRDTFCGTTCSGCGHRLVALERSASGSAERCLAARLGSSCGHRLVTVGRSASGSAERCLAARPVAVASIVLSWWGAVPVAVHRDVWWYDW